MQDYTKRMILPLVGSEDITFRTKSDLEVAKGYVRVVIGQRGPYIEFDSKHIITESFHRIIDDTHRYFVEYRSNCASNVKLYYQLLPVSYADYKTKKFYISPFDLISDKWHALVTPLKRRSKPALDCLQFGDKRQG